MNRISSVGVVATLASALFAAAGCGSSGTGGATSISVSVAPLSEADVVRVTMSVAGPGIDAPIVRDLVKSEGRWQGTIPGIPSGEARSFTATAYDANEDPIHEGSATAPILSGRTTSVSILLQQTTDPDPLSNDPPVVTALSMTSGFVAQGADATLAVSASDPDEGDILRYAWTATGGTFTNDAGTTATWTAPATEGTFALTVTVSDASGSTRSASIAAVVTNDPSTGSAAIDASFNAWPEITGIGASPSLVAPGGSSTVAIEAFDVDGDSLSVSYDDDCGGTFAGSSWTAPSVAPIGGTCRIVATVTDGRFGSTTAATTIAVGDAGCEGLTCVHGTCVESGGVGTCECAVGWTGAGCDEDVDECALGTAGCSPDATCTNVTGGSSCACNEGTVGNGVTCTVCGLYTDVVYAISGAWDVRGASHGLGDRIFNGLEENATSPAWGTNGGTGSTSPFDRPPSAPGVTFTHGFVRLRFTNDATGVPQMAGPVSLVELYFPMEFIEIAGVTLYHDLDISFGVLDASLANCGGGDAACVDHAPALTRPCAGGPSGTFTGTELDWAACTAWLGANGWLYASARAATGPGCATGFNVFGNSNTSSALVPAAMKGDLYQTWNQRLSSLAFSSTAPATASFTMDWIQIPNGLGQTNNWIRIDSATVTATECGSTPGVDLTCDEQP